MHMKHIAFITYVFPFIQIKWKNVRSITYVCITSICVQQNIIEKTLIKNCSSNPYACFGTFAPKSVYNSRHSEPLRYVWKSTNCCYRRKMSSITEFIRIIDQFGHKRGQKKRKYVEYKLNFFLFYMNGQLLKSDSFSAYIIPRTFFLGWICI